MICLVFPLPSRLSHCLYLTLIEQARAALESPQFGADCELVQRRIRSASYSKYGQDFATLSVFRDSGGHQLRDSGVLSCDEFCRVVRLEGKVAPGQVSDKQLRLIFERRVVSPAGSATATAGSVTIDEFATWVWGVAHNDQLRGTDERRATASAAELRSKIRLDTPKMQQLRRMVRAASYVAGGTDYSGLFRYCDQVRVTFHCLHLCCHLLKHERFWCQDHFGEIDLLELARALRCDVKVPVSLLSNHEIERLFATVRHTAFLLYFRCFRG